MTEVARLHAPGDVRVASEPVGPPRAGESLVRVEAVALCGADLHLYEAGDPLPAPLIVGHECAGVVVGGPLDGRRVAVDPALPCGRCDVCLVGNRGRCADVVFAGHGSRDGALRETLCWPTEALHPLPDAIGAVAGALLEPLGVALHAYDLGQVPVAADVAVVGCGPIGLLLIQVARAGGARNVVAVDPLAHRRRAASRAGAQLVLAPEQLPGPVATVDVVFEVAGNDGAVDAAIRLARPGARLVVIGLPADDRTTFDAALARRKGLTLLITRRIKAMFARAIGLVESGGVDVGWLVTDRFGLDRAGEAFARAASREGLKVVVEP